MPWLIRGLEVLFVIWIGRWFWRMYWSTDNIIQRK